MARPRLLTEEGVPIRETDCNEQSLTFENKVNAHLSGTRAREAGPSRLKENFTLKPVFTKETETMKLKLKMQTMCINSDRSCIHLRWEQLRLNQTRAVSRRHIPQRVHLSLNRAA